MAKARVTRRRIGIAEKLVELRAELDVWEAKYGVPSDRLIDVFRNPETGALVETDDFHNWISAYESWRRLTAIDAAS